MKNWRTSLGQIMTAVGLVPSALAYLNIAQLPQWATTAGMICAFVTFIWTGTQAKDKNVTGGDIQQ